ncbi:fatty acid desaturase [Gloeocapsopsis sp. IPPAS B-1203]|uniref:fatty acid desaturase n=1 Tax=Gloeocapsopsis sp. IPPAS B-1203 TaxID=2049454 RepID=UPI000C18EAC3|nr:fatty acid desaturase [Gloeocapsopsis sp. IPPAS B-1203]PIG90793.1 fatty acid desaturase [Gloeocapsopsis sp. IPPAS B-1203]
MTILTTPRSIPTNEETIRLKDILKTLPKECFQQDQRKAWLGLLTNVLLVGLGYAGIAIAPWFVLPLFWIFTGTALTGFFVIAHDCGHRSFAKRRWVNDLVGHIFMLPLIYPFHSWRLLHNHHHLHTNKLDIDNAWQPFRPEVYASSDNFTQWGYRLVRGRFWWVGSIAHWALLHFDWSKFSGKNRAQVKLSVLVVAIFAAIAFPVLVATTGIWGFVKFWLMPWLVYHFWMSTFTLVHHTVSDVPFSTASDWNAATAQLSGTVHCNYPRWIEFLCHDINVHVPHHISTAIPSYNLRLAYSSLQENWAEYLHDELQFSWSLMQQITDECYLYEQKNCYQSFQDYHGISR